MSQALRSTGPTSSAAGSPAKTPPPLRLIEQGSLALEADCSGSSTGSSPSTSDSSTAPDPDGSSSRIPKGFSPVTRDATWQQSPVVWKTSGMGGPTGWWTGEAWVQPSDAVESSWSAIVEETPDPHGKFWVTTPQAHKLKERVASAGARRDPALWEAITALTE